MEKFRYMMNRRVKRLKHRDIVMSNRRIFGIPSLRRSRSNRISEVLLLVKYKNFDIDKSSSQASETPWYRNVESWNLRYSIIRDRIITQCRCKSFDISKTETFQFCLLQCSRSNYYAASMQKFQFCSLRRSKSNRISMVPLLCSVNINKMETFEFCSLRRLKSSDDPTEFPQFHYYRQIRKFRYK